MNESSEYAQELARNCPPGWSIGRHDRSRVCFDHVSGYTFAWGRPDDMPLGETEEERVTDLRRALEALSRDREKGWAP